MSGKDWFGIAVRVLGVWNLFQGIRELVMLTAQLNGWTRGPDTETRYFVFYVVVDLAAAVFMMRGAQIIVDFCYPIVPAPSEPSIDSPAT